MGAKLIITPKTKILDLITDYPELEEVLFLMSPAFKQLKNPILRKTVARVTNLQQAAMVGGIHVEDMINKLRKASGMQEDPLIPSAEGTGLYSQQEVPAWFSKDKVTRHLDAREMLNRGEHPVVEVLGDLHKLPENEIYELIAPFFPAPLIDKATGIGFSNYCLKSGPEEYRVFFKRL
jgi:uncharacterized protein (DUF2249 family)